MAVSAEAAESLIARTFARRDVEALSVGAVFSVRMTRTVALAGLLADPVQVLLAAGAMLFFRGEIVLDALALQCGGSGRRPRGRLFSWPSAWPEPASGGGSWSSSFEAASDPPN